VKKGVEYERTESYAVSKLMNVLFSKEIARYVEQIHETFPVSIPKFLCVFGLIDKKCQKKFGKRDSKTEIRNHVELFL
jgi:chemotaxis protein CheY-P-specific phosphatase CheC